MMQDEVDCNAAASLAGMARSECRRYYLLQPAVTSKTFEAMDGVVKEIQRGIRCLLASRSGQHMAWWRDGEEGSCTAQVCPRVLRGCVKAWKRGGEEDE